MMFNMCLVMVVYLIRIVLYDMFDKRSQNLLWTKSLLSSSMLIKEEMS